MLYPDEDSGQDPPSFSHYMLVEIFWTGYECTGDEEVRRFVADCRSHGWTISRLFLQLPKRKVSGRLKTEKDFDDQHRAICEVMRAQRAKSSKVLSDVKEKTVVPFHDIEFNIIARNLFHGFGSPKTKDISIVLEENLETLEKLFGFDFGTTPQLANINTHSLIPLRQLFPNLPSDNYTGDNLRQKLLFSKDIHVLESPSSIITEENAKLVS